MDFCDWISTQKTCPKHKWSGFDCDANTGEGGDGGAEHHCPKCNHYIGFIAHPSYLKVSAMRERLNLIESLLKLLSRGLGKVKSGRYSECLNNGL